MTRPTQWRIEGTDNSGKPITITVTAATRQAAAEIAKSKNITANSITTIINESEFEKLRHTISHSKARQEELDTASTKTCPHCGKKLPHPTSPKDSESKYQPWLDPVINIAQQLAPDFQCPYCKRPRQLS